MFLLHVLFLVVGCSAIKNVDVLREIDARSAVLRITSHITIDSSTPEYTYLVSDNESSGLSHINAWVYGKPEQTLTVTKTKAVPLTYVVKGNNGAKLPSRFTVACAFTGLVEPKPRESTQGEGQFVKLTASSLYYSLYPTEKQTSRVMLPKDSVLSYSKKVPVNKVANEIAYGPYENIPELSQDGFVVHYENPRPLLTVSEMTRTIEVSHWGNIAVEEVLEVRNAGSKLRGSFSRLDFDMGIGRDTAVTEIKTYLPAAARDIYYRDEIGNISTSDLKNEGDSVVVFLRPRFPLMGGWKTKYTLGYNVPAYEFLFRQGSSFLLKMRLIDHIYNDQLVDKLTVKIILPELASNIKLDPPYAVKQSTDIIKTYLDYSGRPVVIAEANNLVSEHVEFFELSYEFNPMLMVREPLMLIAAFATIFVCSMLYVRLDFTIDRDEKEELQIKTQAIVDDAIDVHQKRTSLYQSYENAVSSFKSSKDSSKFTNNRRNIDAEHKKLNQKLMDLQKKIAVSYPDGAEKMNEIASIDQRYRDLIQESFQLAERLVTGKIAKQQYQVTDNELSGKKTDLIFRMDQLMEGL